MNLPKRVCRGRCGRTTDARTGFCIACESARQRTHDCSRGSARKRGYDTTWDKLSALVKLEEPLCRMCLLQGKLTPTDDVDHIRPFRGMDDPSRLDRSNLQGLCGACHRSKTRIENPR